MPDTSARPHVVVVGSGASGMFAALRLAETARVTLIEAGVDVGSPPPAWLLDDFEFGDRLDWNYRDAETGAPILRGRITGGSTSINSAAALRGQPRDFDEWDVPGWSWSDVVDDFAAIESDREFGDTDGHGSAGPIPVVRLPFGPVDERFAEWAQRRGHAWVDDQNAPGVLGVGPWPSTMAADGQRWSSHAAILPALRDRITLRSSTEVTRVLFDGTTVAGVAVVGPNGPEELAADHVVLSAGAYNSPALLMRSGIGPRGQLDAAGIAMVHESSAVGTGLQDHPWAVLQVRSTRPGAVGARPLNGVLLRYEVEGTGIDADDGVEVHLYPHQALPYLPHEHPDEVFVGMGLMRAVSHGSVGLTADGSPEIRLRHLSDRQDAAAFRAVLRDAIAYVDDMVAEGAFIPPNDPWWHRPDIDAAIAENLDSYGHAVGTCRMGGPSDPGSVVDERLAVRGVHGLSVVDASVMPRSPRANTMLASMMVGWRGAGLVATRLTERP